MLGTNYVNLRPGRVIDMIIDEKPNASAHPLEKYFAYKMYNPAESTNISIIQIIRWFIKIKIRMQIEESLAISSNQVYFFGLKIANKNANKFGTQIQCTIQIRFFIVFYVRFEHRGHCIWR